MQKFASQLKEAKIVAKQEKMLIGNLEKIIINPENGKFLGILITAQKQKNKRVVANATDIRGIGEDYIMLDSVDNISPPNEIIRIKEILDKKIKITGSRVYNEDKVYLGKVNDFTINISNFKLERLYVTSKNLLVRFVSEIVIQKEDIVKIEKDKIIVKSRKIKKKYKIRNAILPKKSAEKTDYSPT